MLLDDLIEHASQRRFIYQHVWMRHDLVMWDNRCTMHRVRSYDDATHGRDLRRVMVADKADGRNAEGLLVPAS